MRERERERERAYLAVLSASYLDISIGPVAQWIRHLPTEPGIAGWSPAGVMNQMLLTQLSIQHVTNPDISHFLSIPLIR